ncbi:MAG: tetratricopeptide repeat protein [Bacteroidales bacterium]|jgi:outer membrane protein assembly factor BamD (BamD/ComL family)|nr:tetratricopeptide repeat protein [Bacteroidales bacterium]
MKNITRILSLLLISITIFSCNSNIEKENLVEEIKKIDEKLFSQKEEAINAELANDALKKYEEYVNTFPEDSLSPELLYKASLIAYGMDDFTKATSFLERIENKYTSYQKYGTVLFQHAFILENGIHDKNSAKQYYQKFINTFPNHVLTEDAKNALIYIDLTDEELLKLFESNNK